MVAWAGEKTQEDKTEEEEDKMKEEEEELEKDLNPMAYTVGANILLDLH